MYIIDVYMYCTLIFMYHGNQLGTGIGYILLRLVQVNISTLAVRGIRKADSPSVPIPFHKPNFSMNYGVDECLYLSIHIYI